MVTSEQAMHVVRNYILPMFEADNRAVANKARASLLGTFEVAAAKVLKPLTALSGTVFGELKLSDRLMLELTDAKETSKRFEAQANDALQAKASALMELKLIHKKHKEVQTELQLLRHQFDSLKLASDQSDLAKSMMVSMLQELKSSYIANEDERRRLNSELNDLKALNDKFKNKATELEHSNSLLRMENDVIGERLKGLYDSFASMLGRRSFEEKVRQEFKAAAFSSVALAEFTSTMDNGLIKTADDRDVLRDEFEETLKQRDEMKGERDRLFGRLKKEGTKWEVDYKKVDEERNKVANDYTELEKRHKMMTEEQDKTRQKLKQLRIKRRQFGGLEEKACKNCGKAYFDNENFNWSCRIHFSQYGGEMWWCCGKEGQNAPGCRLSKHECKEDEDDENEQKDEGQVKASSVRCTVTPR
jgi:chromosome segregation ATPase